MKTMQGELDLNISMSSIDPTNEHYEDFIEHHGIKGQKWGNRRYQNSDGSLTALGRVHYGVGAARSGISKGAKAIAGAAKNAATKTGSAVRKKVNPTNEELEEKLNAAKEKAKRRDMKNEIKELSGKKKKLKDMTDQEVIDKFNRLQKEAAIRKMEKEARQTPVGRFIENNAKQGFNRAMNAVVEDKVKSLFAKEKDKPYSEVLKERKAKLQLDVMDGDDEQKESAKRKLDDLNAISSKKKNDGNKDKDNKDKDNKDNKDKDDKNKNNDDNNASKTKEKWHRVTYEDANGNYQDTFFQNESGSKQRSSFIPDEWAKEPATKAKVYFR